MVNTRFIRIMFNNASDEGYGVIERVLPKLFKVNGNTYQFIV